VSESRRPYPTDLSDAEWPILAPLLTEPKQTGCTRHARGGSRSFGTPTDSSCATGSPSAPRAANACYRDPRLTRRVRL
jgi:transposase